MNRRRAMIMAAGHGTRMVRSGVTIPKVLLDIGGATLLEHNFRQLVRFGFDDITVAIPSTTSAISGFVQTTLAPLAAYVGVDISIAGVPLLGNIGALGAVPADGPPVLAVFADNLTTLDLDAMYLAHLEARCAMTIAVHEYAHAIPFGEVALSGDRVTAYREKPVRMTMIASGVTIAGPRALGAIGKGEVIGLDQLVRRMIDTGEEVLGYAHSAAWIDVNDASSIAQAKALIEANRHAFRDSGIASANETIDPDSIVENR